MKGQLRCEWCNRMFQIPRWLEQELTTRNGRPKPFWEVWELKREGIFYCQNPRCIDNRSEVIVEEDA